LAAGQSQTEFMAHIYLLFAFAKDEEKAQQARHKLETWRQAFRLDKKLLYKVERAAATADGDKKPVKTEAKAEKAKGKGKNAGKAETPAAVEETSASNEEIRLLVRLGFSGHEKLSEQRWLERIPSEEPFRGSSPVIVKHGEAKFEETERQFEELD